MLSRKSRECYGLCEIPVGRTLASSQQTVRNLTHLHSSEIDSHHRETETDRETDRQIERKGKSKDKKKNKKQKKKERKNQTRNKSNQHNY